MIGDSMFFMILVERYIIWVRFWNRFRGTQTLNVNLYIHTFRGEGHHDHERHQECEFPIPRPVSGGGELRRVGVCV